MHTRQPRLAPLYRIGCYCGLPQTAVTHARRDTSANDADSLATVLDTVSASKH